MSDKIDLIENVTGEILRLVGVKSEVQIKQYDEMIIVNVISEDSALLIGLEGETLDSLQHIIRVIVESKLGEYVRITVDAGGFRQRNMDRLEILASRVAKKVKEAGKAEALRPMNAADRRIIHMKVKQMEGVVSESIGEGRDRVVVIKPILKKIW